MLDPEKAKEAAQNVRIALAVVNHVEIPQDVQITCEHCEHNDTCEYRFDLPNTDDNCLAGYSWLTKSVVPSFGVPPPARGSTTDSSGIV